MVRAGFTISLPLELEQLVKERLATGRYQTASEVVREGLRLLQNQERDHEAAFAELKAKLQRGAAEAERGEFVGFEEVLEAIDERKRSRKASDQP